MTANDLYSLFQLGSVITLFLTFALGTGAILTGLKVNRDSAKQILALETRLAEAQVQASKAQLELRRYIERVAKKARGRTLSPKFVAALKGHPAGTAEIWYLPDSTEVYLFSLQLSTALTNEAGWKVTAVKPIPKDGTKPDIPLSFQATGNAGLCLRAKRFELAGPINTPEDALARALGVATEAGGDMVLLGDPSLPDGHAVIIVGQPVEIIQPPH